MRIALTITLLLAAISVSSAPALHAANKPAAKQTVYVPKKNSAERQAILDAIYGDIEYGDAGGKFVPKVAVVRVFHAKGQRSITYLKAEGPVGWGQMLLTKTGEGAWTRIWGEGDGGSNACKTGQKHYAWAINLIRRQYGLAPDALVPGISSEYKIVADQAAEGADVHCVGDIDGGGLGTEY